MSAADDALDDLIELARVPAPTFDEGERIAWLQRRLAGAPGRTVVDTAGNLIWAFDGARPKRAAARARRHGLRARRAARAADRGRARARARDRRQRRGGRVRRPGRRAARPAGRGRGRRRRVHGRRGGPRQPRRRALRVRDAAARAGRSRSRATASRTSPSTAVGSLRARITVRGPGGHSWANRGRPSAIDEVCRIARTLSRQPRGDASTNIGLIQGGTAVNAIAAHAELVIEQRALDETLLARFGRALQVLTVEPPLTLEIEEVGQAPGRAARPPPAAARDRAPRARGARPARRARRGLDRRQRRARRGHPGALPRLRDRAARCTRPDEYIEIGSLATGREQLRQRAARPALGQSRGHDPSPIRSIRSTRAELERAVACVRRERDLARRRALRQRGAARSRQGRAGRVARRRRRRRRARRRSSCSPTGARARRSSTSAPTRSSPGSTFRACTPRSRATSTPSPRSAVKADPGFRAALELRGVRDLEPRDGGHLVGRACSRSRAAASGARWRGCAATSRATTATPARSAACSRSSTSTAWRSCASTTTAPCRCRSEHGDYRNGGGRPYRDDLKPIEVAQPEGTSLQLDGRALTLGAVARAHRLQPARVADAARARLRRRRRGRGPPIAHRLSIAELAIPYADTNPTVVFKNAFDIGEYGLGPYVNSLALGCDCLGEIRYLDAVVHDSQGRPQTIANAICLHEEDSGILWKHFDWRSGATDVRRARKLVISSIATVGNYEYGLYWYLTLDGGDRVRGQAHGRPAHRRRGARASRRTSATLVAPGVQRRLPPALLLRAPRPGRRRRAQRRWSRSTRSPIPPGPRIRTASRSTCARRRSRASSRRSA